MLTRDKDNSFPNRGKQRAIAHANRLTRETGIKHIAVETCINMHYPFTFWVVKRKGLLFNKSTKIEYEDGTGKKL